MNKMLLGGFSLIATMEVAALEWQNVPPIQGPNFGYSNSTNSYQQQQYQQQQYQQQQYQQQQQQQQQQQYQSSRNNNYQYDLNNDSDRLRYSIDTEAQMRDRTNYNPSVQMDRNNGEYGGGYYNGY